MMKRQMKALLMALPFSLLLSGCQSAGLQIPENGITMELGAELPSSAADYVVAEEYGDITIDTQEINTQAVGTYIAIVLYKGKEVGTVPITVTDTTAPSATIPETILLEKGSVCSVDDHVTDITDFSETQVWFLADSLGQSDRPESDPSLADENLTKEITVTEDGDYQITVLVKDIHGNYNLYTLPLEVYTPDTEAPVITASDLTVTIGETPDYLTGISASDNVDNDLTDQVQVDASQVLTSKEGIYPVIYTVSDKAGNIGTMECKVTVQAPKKSTSSAVTAKPEEFPATESQPEPAEASGPAVNTTPAAPQPAQEPEPTPTPEAAPAPASTPEPAPETTPEPAPIVTPEPAPPVTPAPTPDPGTAGTITETQPVQPETPSAPETPEAAAGFDIARADELLSLVNAEREARGIGTVATKDSLTEKAKERAQSGNYSGSGVISCYGTGATSTSVVIDNWKADWPDGTWMTAAWKYAGAACYVDGDTYSWVVVFGAY